MRKAIAAYAQSAWTVIKRGLQSAYVRTAVGAAVSGGCAMIGLHVSPEMVAEIMLAGAILAGLGPHNPGDQ